MFRMQLVSCDAVLLWRWYRPQTPSVIPPQGCFSMPIGFQRNSTTRRMQSTRTFLTQRLLSPASAPRRRKLRLGGPISSTQPVRAVAAVQSNSISAASNEPDGEINSLPDMFRTLAKQYPNHTSLEDPHHGESKYTFSALYEEMCSFAAGLALLGAKEGSTVGQFSENSARWLVADQGVMLNGAANAVRGANTNTTELAYIMKHSQCTGLILQDAGVLSKLVPHLHSSGRRVRFVVILWGDVSVSIRQQAGVNVLLYKDLLESGRSEIAKQRWSAEDFKLQRDTIATLVYTSGTSGLPKAAALSHGNILYQVESFPTLVTVSPGQRALSLLPPWHVYERTVEYHILSQAASIIYSSVTHFKRDLASYTPHFLCCVPLLLDRLHARVLSSLSKLSAVKSAIAQLLVSFSIAHIKARRILRGVASQFSLSKPSMPTYIAAVCTFLFTALGNQLAKIVVFSKVRKEMGVRTAVICGGGSLAPHLDDFYEALELPVLNGWGLTEASPVLACRAMETDGEPQHNTRGTVGLPLPGTRIKVVDPENLTQELLDGDVGVLLAKGPGLMKEGYFQDPAATEAAFVGGFFNTGDLGKRVPEGNLMSGQIMLTGRSKDTITLLDGENVPPQPIEDALCRSALLEHVMLIGQDKRTLGALVCLSTEELERRMKEGGDERLVGELSQTELDSLAVVEISKLNRERLEAERYEVISGASVLREPFSVENGTLTQTLKLRRNAVHKLYEKEVSALLERLR